MRTHQPAIILQGQFLILNITGLTFTIDDSNRSLKGITRVHEDQLLFTTEKVDEKKIENTIKEIEKCGPLNGKRFFEITRTTLTGMASITITYIIILVQFKK